AAAGRHVKRTLFIARCNEQKRRSGDEISDLAVHDNPTIIVTRSQHSRDRSASEPHLSRKCGGNYSECDRRDRSPCAQARSSTHSATRGCPSSAAIACNIPGEL